MIFAFKPTALTFKVQIHPALQLTCIHLQLVLKSTHLLKDISNSWSTITYNTSQNVTEIWTNVRLLLYQPNHPELKTLHQPPSQSHLNPSVPHRQSINPGYSSAFPSSWQRPGIALPYSPAYPLWVQHPLSTFKENQTRPQAASPTQDQLLITVTQDPAGPLL